MYIEPVVYITWLFLTIMDTITHFAFSREMYINTLSLSRPLNSTCCLEYTWELLRNVIDFFISTTPKAVYIYRLATDIAI